ncbi:MAG: nuclear transport factor 2 family protein [Candidatus Hydrogenedentes bacterium]|nr:nuclear transport factor 2 family protein [Candidatus Hydrogenedentota bacterium]
MKREGNKAVVERYVEAFNRGDLETLCALFAEDAVVYGVLGWGGIDKVKPIWAQLITSLRMQLRIESIVEEGDIVAVRYTESGVFSAPFMGTPPTGKTYEVVAMEWFELRAGRILRRWGARDSAAIYRQLGIPLSP